MQDDLSPLADHLTLPQVEVLSLCKLNSHLDLVPPHSPYLHLIRVFQRAHLHLRQDSVVLLRHKASLHLASVTHLNSLASRRNLPLDLLPRLGLEVQCPVRKELRHRFRQVFNHQDMLGLVEYGL